MTQSQTRVCQNCKTDFSIEPEDFAFYEKVRVPPPTWCPECRMVRRLMWRNERTLYKRKCQVPGHTEDVMSMYPPERPIVVYDQKYHWSDAWDPMEYGRDIDFARPFLEQFRELLEAVPRPNLSTEFATMINSEYSNWAGSCKNCYLVTDADYVEDSGYCASVFRAKDCWDCNTIGNSELCYESFNLNQCYRTCYSVNCSECSNVWFSKNCVGCSDCFGCVNLRKRSYNIFNVQYSKEDYERKLKELLQGDFSALAARVREHWMAYPNKNLVGLQNVNSTGDYLFHSKNTSHAFLASDVEDSKFIALIHSPGTKDCYDYADWGDNASLLYEAMTVGLGAVNVKMSQLVAINTRDVTYSYWCTGCKDLFGCVGLKKKEYCILNRQYTREEYEALVPKLIAHMDAMPYTDSKGRVYRYGEFFPPEFSPFAYNESAAQEFFPMKKEDALASGFAWADPPERAPQVTVRSADLPSWASEASDRAVSEVFECSHLGQCGHPCAKAFRVIPGELQFLKKMDLPFPRVCPGCRHFERFAYRNPMRLRHGNCQCGGAGSRNGAYRNVSEHAHGAMPCGAPFTTTYPPDSLEIVYCERCYAAEAA